MGAFAPSFVTHRPALPLTRFVSRLWASERAGLVAGRELNLPTGRVDLVIPLLEGQSSTRFQDAADREGQHYHGPIVSGAHDRARERATTPPSSVVGVQFRPGGAAAFFGRDTAVLQNQTLLLDTFWGAFARDLQERLQAVKEVGARLRLLESLLTSRLDSARAPDRRVDAALTVLHRDPTAARVGPAHDDSGLGTTRFIRRFHAEVGLTPKRYARVLRLTTLLRLIPAEGARDLAGLAAEVGYADQAHLAHDFRALTGLTLSEYRAAAPDRPTHVARREDFDKTRRQRSGKVVT